MCKQTTDLLTSPASQQEPFAAHLELSPGLGCGLGRGPRTAEGGGRGESSAAPWGKGAGTGRCKEARGEKVQGQPAETGWGILGPRATFWGWRGGRGVGVRKGLGASPRPTLTLARKKGPEGEARKNYWVCVTWWLQHGFKEFSSKSA